MSRLRLIRTAIVAAMLLAASLPRPAFPAPVEAPAGPGLLPPVRGVLTQPFGCTELALEPPAPGCPGGHFHAGIDIGAAAGSTVVSPAPGVVARVAFDEGGYGNFVEILHPGSLSTRFAHLEAPLVGAGARLARGDAIGLLGSTGNSTGPHLHFEVRDHGRLADPMSYLATDPTEGGFRWLTR